MNKSIRASRHSQMTPVHLICVCVVNEYRNVSMMQYIDSKATAQVQSVFKCRCARWPRQNSNTGRRVRLSEPIVVVTYLRDYNSIISMIPTITKNYQNVVISTGNIINNELGQRRSNEELYDGLQKTLHDDPKSSTSESVVVEIDKLHGRVLCATQELKSKLTENERNEISIGAKIFLNKNSTACVNEAVEALLNILNVTYVDNVVLAYHPIVANATPLTTTTPRSPCSESAASSTSAAAGSSTTSSGTSSSASTVSWSSRNGDQGIAELKLLYKQLEQFAQKQQIKQLGIADLDAKALAELHKTSEVAPTIAQVNLAACCVVPVELQEFCRDHELVLNTHSDPEMLLPEEKFTGLAPGYTIDWSLRYQVHVRCRGVLTAKGYIVGASKPPSADNN